MQSVAGDENSRRGTFEDLLQTYCLGMMISKSDTILELFEWTKEEKHYLSELP